MEPHWILVYVLADWLILCHLTDFHFAHRKSTERVQQKSGTETGLLKYLCFGPHCGGAVMMAVLVICKLLRSEAVGTAGASAALAA